MGASAKSNLSLYRAARYTLRAHDSRGMRFSAKRKGGEIFNTSIINLSETGLAFRVDIRNAPFIGETIKVEFSVPGERYKIAWFADVVWLETPYNLNYKEKESVRVGIRFHSMPARHRKILSDGLKSRFRELESIKRRARLVGVIQSIPEAMMYVGIIALAVGFIYYFSQRTPTYNSDKPTAWGERFFEKVIKDQGPAE